MTVVDDSARAVKVSEQELDQSRFTAAVGSDDEYLLAALDLEIQIAEKCFRCGRVGEVESADVQNVVSALQTARKLHLDRALVLFGSGDAVDLGKHFESAFGGDDISLAVPAALLFDVSLLTRDLLLLILILLFKDLAVAAALLGAGGVATFVELCASALKEQGLVCDLVEESAVVRYRDEASRII